MHELAITQSLVDAVTERIENVGNLVCPALFDLGEAAKVVVVSVTEGEEKPLKYPQMFSVADLVVIQQDRPAALCGRRAGTARGALPVGEPPAFVWSRCR
jgi:Ni2+-binding GTPase involved in maturation of urease and hydrogenase